MDNPIKREQDSYLATSNLYLETCFSKELLAEYSDGLKLVQSFNHKPIFVWVVSYPAAHYSAVSPAPASNPKAYAQGSNKLFGLEEETDLSPEAPLEKPKVEKKWVFNLLEKDQLGFPRSFQAP